MRHRMAFVCLSLCVTLSVILSMTLLSSCTAKEPRIGLLLYNQADPYIETFARRILSEAKGSFSMTQLDAGNSQLIQNEQIEAQLSRKPALLMINPVDRLAANALIRRLQAEDVPVIFFNREPLAKDLALWERCYYVGAKAEQSGQMQAELIMDLFGGDSANLNDNDKNHDGVIQIILLKGEQGHQDAELRTKELLRSFESGGFAIEILALEVCNWRQDEAYDKMGALIRSFRNRVEIVVSNNDAMALGAIMRMRQLGFFKDDDGNGKVDGTDASWLPVVGIDGLAEAEEAIADGYLYGTVKNDSLSMAKAMVELADRILDGSALGHTRGDAGDYLLEDKTYIWIDYQPFVR